MRPTLLALTTLFTACGIGTFGDGHLQSDSRDVGAFRSVSIASGFQAVVSPGPRGVTVRTDENVLPLVETFVQGESLVVHIKSGTLLEHTTALEVAVSNPTLEGLEASGGSQVDATATATAHFAVNASGGSEVKLDGLSSDAIEVDASGGSHVTLTGAATGGTASASGGSHVDLKAIALDTLNVDASGGSEIDATVATSVTGTASGGSTVSITGNPTLSVRHGDDSDVTASH
jgi:hypothetical protein